MAQRCVHAVAHEYQYQWPCSLAPCNYLLHLFNIHSFIFIDFILIHHTCYQKKQQKKDYRESGVRVKTQEETIELIPPHQCNYFLTFTPAQL